MIHDPCALKTKNEALGNVYRHHDSIEFVLARTGLDSEDYKRYFLRIKRIIKASFRHYPDELGLAFAHAKK